MALADLFGGSRLLPTAEPGRRDTAGALLLLLLLLAFQPSAQAWELRVCAEPNNLPFSNQAEEGFENRIAEIVADELGATLSYEWLPAARTTDRLLYLRRGDCDVVVGVGDGTEGYLTTVAYYRSSPVFVYPEDAPFDLVSFDDEVLRSLSIGVLAGVGVRPEVAALANRDLMQNVTSFSWAEGETPLAAPVEAVAAGEVDVAILWGPVGSYFARRNDTALEVVPAEPKVDLPFLSLVVPLAMGVRQQDEALRDLLNEAIAGRWEEIREVLESFDVPLEPLPRPSLSASTTGAASVDTLEVGLLLPLATGAVPLRSDAPHEAAAAARMGAVLAEERLGSDEAEPALAVELFVSGVPSPEAARRAGERMIAHGADALVGGIGQGQAEILSRVAAASEVPFLNIGSSMQAPGSHCPEFTFHVEASASMYLSALASALGQAGLDRWLVAHPDSAEGRRLLELSREAATRTGALVAGVVVVEDDSRLMDVVTAAQGEGADAIVALLDWRAQLDLAGFVSSVGEGPVLTGYPYPVSQTRNFYYSLANVGAGNGNREAVRVALWDASLAEGEAGELNTTFFERWGEPMDPQAWAAYLSLDLLHQVVVEAESVQGEILVAGLEGTAFGMHKGSEGRFDPATHQLGQPLYGVLLEPAAGSREELVKIFGRFLPPFDVTGANRCGGD